MDEQVRSPSDPSDLTTAAILREVASLEKLMAQRMDAIEKAVTVAHENLVRVPTGIDQAIGHLRQLVDERDLRYDQRFKAQTEAVATAMTAAEKAVAAALSAADRAVAKAETASEKRLEALNEFRGSLNDMMTRLIQRSEADQRFGALAEKIDSVQQRLDKSEGKGAGLDKGWGTLVGLVALVSSLIAIFVVLSRGMT